MFLKWETPPVGWFNSIPIVPLKEFEIVCVRVKQRERLKNSRIWYYAAHSVMQYKSPIYRTGKSLSLDQFRWETKTNSLTELLTTLTD